MHFCAFDKLTQLNQVVNRWLEIKQKVIQKLLFSKEIRFLVPEPAHQLQLSFHLAKTCLYFCNVTTVSQKTACSILHGLLLPLRTILMLSCFG